MFQTFQDFLIFAKVCQGFIAISCIPSISLIKLSLENILVEYLIYLILIIYSVLLFLKYLVSHCLHFSCVDYSVRKHIIDIFLKILVTLVLYNEHIVTVHFLLL